MRRKPLFVVPLAAVPSEPEVTLVRSLKGKANRVNRLLYPNFFRHPGLNPRAYGLIRFGVGLGAELQDTPDIKRLVGFTSRAKTAAVSSAVAAPIPKSLVSGIDS